MKQKLNQVDPTHLENSRHHKEFKFWVNQGIMFPVKSTWQFIMQEVLRGRHALDFALCKMNSIWIMQDSFDLRKKDAKAKIPTF